MYLKRLELLGFKTFADRTDLEFGQGITCVVGPNGSGKSNISDSILWALGEQSFKSLRASRSQDVIFAGSPARKAIGVAEVSVTFDNSRAILPLDFQEVTITRRVFRTGESEFFINRTPCRLKDIHDLLLDTGIGKQSYSVISQNEVDAVLSARSEDRRELLEEAAGIQKYRHRKRETQRKLENSRANLLRVTDIIAELESQVGPLADQCEGARRYQELAAELNKLKLGLLVNQYLSLTASLARSREREAELEQEIEQNRTALQQHAANEAELRVRLQKVEEELEAQRGLVARLVSEAERAESRLNLDRERLASLERQRESLMAELSTIGPRLEAAQAALAQHQEEIVSLQAKQADFARLVAEKEQELAEVATSVEQASADEVERRSAYLEALSRIADSRNSLTQCQSLLRAAQARLARLAEQLATSAQELESGEQEVAAKETALAAAQQARAESEARLQESRAQRVQIEKQVADLQESCARLSEELAQKESRLNALQEVEAAREGYSAGVQAVFAAANEGRLSGQYQTVADLVRAPERFRLAIETALGQSLENIVVADEQAARQAIAHLKSGKAGRATFLPLDRIRSSALPPAPVDTPGCLGRAVDLVEFQAPYRTLFEHLLGSVLVAEDLEAALRIGGAFGAIVTLEGELLEPGGALSGGSSEGQPSLLARKQEIEDLSRQLAEVRTRMDKDRTALDAAKAELARLTQQVAANESALDANRRQAAACEREREVAKAQLVHRQERKASLEAEQTALAAEATESERESNELAGQLAAVEAEKDKLEEAMRSAEQSYKAGESERTDVAAALSELRVALARAQGELRSRENQVEATRKLIVDLEADRQRKQEQAAGLGEEAAQTVTRIAEEEQRGQSLAASRDEGEAQLQAARARRQEMLESVSAKLAEIEAARSQQEEMQNRLHRSQLRTTQLASEIGFTEQKLLEDHRLTPEQAERVHEPIESRVAAQERVAVLDAEIAALGPVNLGAMEEYQRVTQRLEFLTTQRADLEKARDDLMQVIAQIDKEATSSFLETFEQVRREFHDLFLRLFNGGETELIITNQEDVLESGIDINVTIPGKHNRNLLALSGGERALTAAAFLFALLRVRPTPFVVLDEIDAPLDDSNVNRYCEVLQEFARKSQFIIITHNKGTMEAADSIYGVTMETAGVSRLISMRLTDAQAMEAKNGAPAAE